MLIAIGWNCHINYQLRKRFTLEWYEKPLNHLDEAVRKFGKKIINDIYHELFEKKKPYNLK